MAGILSHLLVTGSLNAFYDEIVFWEMAKGKNRFFVTFEKGKFGITNNKRESIGTGEIDFPHMNEQIDGYSAGSVFTNLREDANRFVYSYKLFMEQEEISDNPARRMQNNGHITMTQLKGTRGFRTYLTGSNENFAVNTYTYEVYNPTSGSSLSFRTVSCSYFWPHTHYQLSVLRTTPTVTINLNKLDELPYGLGDKPFCLIPDHTSQQVKDNLEFYLEKAGLLPKTTKTKVPVKPEKGGGKPRQGIIGQGFDYGRLEEAQRKLNPNSNLLGQLDREFKEDRDAEQKRLMGLFNGDRNRENRDRGDARGGGPLRGNQWLRMMEGERANRRPSERDPRNPNVHMHPHKHKGKHGQKRSKHKHKKNGNPRSGDPGHSYLP